MGHEVEIERSRKASVAAKKVLKELNNLWYLQPSISHMSPITLEMLEDVLKKIILDEIYQDMGS